MTTVPRELSRPQLDKLRNLLTCTDEEAVATYAAVLEIVGEPEAGDDDAFQCESCGKVIASGDKYTVTLDGCHLCEEHAPSFQDCVDYWADHAVEDDDEREAAEDCRASLAAHVAAGGKPDDKPLFAMEENQ